MVNVSQAPLILITGGSRGVGFATARLAAERGYDVAISYVANESAALAVTAGVEALGQGVEARIIDSVCPVSSRSGLPHPTTQPGCLARNALECATESGLGCIAQTLRYLFNR